MKTLIAAATVALSVLVVSPLQAQTPNAAGQNAKKYGIAVVDISFIFKNHNAFKGQMEKMKGEVESIDGQLKAEKQKIIDMEQERQRYKPGTAEFSSLDDKLATAKAQFQLNLQRMRKNMLEKEARVYYNTYQQVSKTVDNYARYHNIGIVLGFNGDPADPAQHESVMRDIRKLVQFQNQVDITPDILAIVNSTRVGANGGAPAPR